MPKAKKKSSNEDEWIEDGDKTDELDEEEGDSDDEKEEDEDEDLTGFEIE